MFEMLKVGCMRVKTIRCKQTSLKCLVCGAPGMYKVTFKDTWCTLNVILCKVCAAMDYEQLPLQKIIQFPVIA